MVRASAREKPEVRLWRHTSMCCVAPAQWRCGCVAQHEAVTGRNHRQEAKRKKRVHAPLCEIDEKSTQTLLYFEACVGKRSQILVNMCIEIKVSHPYYLHKFAMIPFLTHFVHDLRRETSLRPFWMFDKGLCSHAFASATCLPRRGT